MGFFVISSNVYIPDIDKDYGGKTGLPVEVGQIITNMPKIQDIKVFTTNQIRSKNKLNNITILGNKPLALLKYFRFKHLGQLFGRGVESALKGFYHKLEFEKIKKSIDKKDVVNIHDLSELNIQIIKYCTMNKISVVATLHIYIDKNYNENEFKGYKDLVNYQNKLFSNAEVHVVVVSNGMKDRILRDYPDYNAKNISVISNGIKISDFNEQALKLSQQSEIKTLVCVGTICERKNQIQILRALSIIDREERKNLKVVFVGKDQTNGLFEQQIKDMNISDCASYYGECEHRYISNIYSSCYATISTSLNEAFGLTIIEGFSYGKPAIFFKDIDAAEELFSEDAVCLIKGKSDKDVAQAILECINKNYHSEKIIEHGKKWDIKKAAKSYTELYKRLSNN